MDDGVVEVVEDISPGYMARRTDVPRVAEEVRDLGRPQPRGLDSPITLVEDREGPADVRVGGGDGVLGPLVELVGGEVHAVRVAEVGLDDVDAPLRKRQRVEIPVAVGVRGARAAALIPRAREVGHVRVDARLLAVLVEVVEEVLEAMGELDGVRLEHARRRVPRSCGDNALLHEHVGVPGVSQAGGDEDVGNVPEGRVVVVAAEETARGGEGKGRGDFVCECAPSSSSLHPARRVVTLGVDHQHTLLLHLPPPSPLHRIHPTVQLLTSS